MLLTTRQVEQALQLGRTRTYELIRSGEPGVPPWTGGPGARDGLLQWIETRSSRSERHGE